jgi:DNA polymerase-1
MRRIGGPETVRHVLVDGNNLLRRAYYVFVEDRKKQGEQPIMSKSGAPLGLFYGVLNLLNGWLYDLTDPTRISVFFDGIPKHRLAIDPKYKERDDRSPLDFGSSVKVRGVDYPNQYELLTTVLRGLGCDLYWHADEEADDLIASFVKAHLGEVNIILSSDKDFFQLVGDRVVIYRPGIPPPRLFDAERVGDYYEKKWKFRLRPDQIRMFKTLTGDPSDNICGVPRIRKKVASTLCDAPNIEAVLLMEMQALSTTERSNLLAMRERLELNWQLVGLRDNIDLEPCLSPADPDFSGIRELCNELNMNLDLLAFRVGPYSLSRTALPLPDILSELCR